jgi:beta-lactamase regulating signal transducer with metallopeptidase domain
MIAYIIKSSLSLIVMFGLYWIFLRKEKLFRFNRFFLIFSLLISLVIPFISVPVNIQNNEVQKNIVTVLNYSIPAANDQPAPNSVQKPVIENTIQPIAEKITPAVVKSEGISFTQLLIILYFAGVVLLLFRFLRNILFISNQKRLSENTYYSGQKLVLIDSQINPYCFINAIFVSKKDYLENRIDKELLNHEVQHIKQAHSIDIIFMELIQSFYWFNPILIFYNKAARVNHEYLADNSVLSNSNDVKSYADILLNFISCNRNIPLTSGFNQSLTRKRLNMMVQPKSKGMISKVRVIITLGLVLILTLILSFKQAKPLPITPMTIYKGVIDTLLIDKDSLKTKKKILNLIPQSTNVVDENVTYTASGYIKRDTINKMIVLIDNAIVSFGEITIKADSIVFDKRTNQIYAIGRQNSSGTIIGKPIFKEGFREFVADELTYNLKTRKTHVKNIKAQEDIKLKDNGSPFNSPTQNQIDKSKHYGSNAIKQDTINRSDTRIFYYPNPLYIVHETQPSQETNYTKSLMKLYSPNIKGNQLFKGDDQVRMYGERARVGVIVVTKRSGSLRTDTLSNHVNIR